jgi:flagellum-specific ATP synthase
MAQREIGLSASEPPTTKGYPPSVFAELPKLLERAGPGVDQKESNNGVKTGYITGLFTVLVDGDDTNEPISDAVRGILDGHIILDRSIAERGRFPAINILKSISRTMPGCHSENEQNLIKKTKLVMATYEDMVDMIRLGAYRPGTNEEVDRSISIYPALHDFLSQKNHECMRMDEAFSALSSIMETVS